MKLYRSDRFNDYELKHKKASYETIVKMLVGDIVLCNKITEIDYSI